MVKKQPIISLEKTEEDLRSAHNIQQEEYRRSLQGIELTEIKLHPAGGFDKKTGFVYEPVGGHEYLWKFKGLKGLSKAELTGTVKCKCGDSITYFGDKKYIKCPNCEKIIRDLTPKWKLVTEIKNLELEFENEPLDKIIFGVPSRQVIDFWLNNWIVDENKKEITEEYIFYALKRYFQTYFDFPFSERESSILALAAIQSWLVEILDTIFYIAISGETGSGKTVLGEALINVSRHGFMANSISSSGIARCIEGMKLSIFFDEIDNKKHEKDEDISGILRQGYRKNNFFVRMHPKTFAPETFNTFGFKSFSFRSEVVDDLQNRSIGITLAKTKSQSLPIINMFKKFKSPADLMFFWYMDNISYIFTQHPYFLKEMCTLDPKFNKDVCDEVNDINRVNIVIVNNNNINIEKERSGLTQEIPYLPNYVNFVNQKAIFGRNIEISFLIYTLCQIIRINLENIISELIEEKQDAENANEEEGWLGLLKDTFKSQFPKRIVRDDMEFVTYKFVIKEYMQRMRETYDIVPSQHQIKKMLRQIGFIESLNKKVVKHEGKAILALIYDSEIRKRLGIEDDTYSR